MRPVIKYQIGTAVPYMDSNGVIHNEIIQDNYNPYKTAKPLLKENIGQYCSYCEEYREMGDIHVEHVEAKSKLGNEFAWDNFLLACNICNSIKGDDNCKVVDFHTPHRNNTFLSFIYEKKGMVRVNPALNGKSKAHAEKLYDIVKLGRYPGGKEAPTESDFRWESRSKAWNEAALSKLEYDTGGEGVENVIVDFKRGKCEHWSIWFTVFKGYDEVRRALLDVIPGTCKSCFDANNHYEPIERNPGNEDPV